MKVYVLLIEHRHTDPEVHVYLQRDEAIASARNIAHSLDTHGDYREVEVQGWEFLAYYSCEDDSVRVTAHEAK